MPSRHEEERVRLPLHSPPTPSIPSCKMALTRTQQSEEGSVGDGLPDLGDSIDALTFEQILEMDDDEDEREFRCLGPSPTTSASKSHTNLWGSVKALFLDSLIKPRRLLSRWTRHCEWTR